MSQVETVALWVSLLIGVASMVLAVVTIVLAISAERRSERVSSQTIQSLQKIETTVERQSQDTGQLIKAAWDKLLGAVGDRPLVPEVSINEIVAGITAELRAERISAVAEGAIDGKFQENIERSVAALERLTSSNQSENVDHNDSTVDLKYISNLLDELSPSALEFVRIMNQENLHLTYSQYKGLLQAGAESSVALRELRDCDLVIPLRSATLEPVYWFPPKLSGIISPALVMISRDAPDIHSRLRRRLSEFGYPEGSSS